MHSTTATPGSYGGSPTDWAVSTPASSAYTMKASTTTAKAADLEPADLSVPAFAAFGGRLYAARNTTSGPQLWGCDPALSGAAGTCEPNDWSLVAPNSTGDVLLTQFNDPGNTRVTLLAATATHLYVGFNNGARGVMLFRTASPAPASPADFSGTAGCSAALSPASCEGFGLAGLGGGALVTRIYSAIVLPYGGSEYLYLVAGDGVGAVRVFRVQP